jgi:hypothetical protein
MKATDMPVSILAYTPFSVHIIWILYESAYGWVTANAVGSFGILLQSIIWILEHAA